MTYQEVMAAARRADAAGEAADARRLLEIASTMPDRPQRTASPIIPAQPRGGLLEVELFDGTILEFPQGTDPAVIDRAARDETRARRQPSPGIRVDPSPAPLNPPRNVFDQFDPPVASAPAQAQAAGPWDKYAQPAPAASGPWDKYAAQSAPQPAAQAAAGMIEVEIPDGRILEFPAGTTQDVMRGAIDKLLAEPAPTSGAAAAAAMPSLVTPPAYNDGSVAPAAPAPDQAEDAGFWSWAGDMATDVAGSVARGLRKGVSNIAGAPVEVVNASPMLGNLLPGEQGMTPMSDSPVGGARWFDELLRGGVGGRVRADRSRLSAPDPARPHRQPRRGRSGRRGRTDRGRGGESRQPDGGRSAHVRPSHRRRPTHEPGCANPGGTDAGQSSPDLAT